jgi:phosphoglycerate dehydrogenase-like enzyme
MGRLRGLFILEPQSYDAIYGPEERLAIERRVDLLAPPITREFIASNPHLLRSADVIFSGWGGPMLDDAFLQAAPKLKAFFYGAGTVGYCLTEAVFERGVVVTTANAANAVPVAEYTLATILFSLKHGWRHVQQTRERRTFAGRDGAPGAYGSVIGIVSLGTIGREVVARLRPFDLKLWAYDPFVSELEAKALGVQLVPLGKLFKRCDVVSLHTPCLEETIGMITGEHLASMKPNATFINTARGEIVREDEMIVVAKRRPDLQFVLDVAHPEPPPAESPLYTMPNVVLTPHIAGSAGAECRRMGRYMVEELERFIAGKPLKWQVTAESSRHSTHRPVAMVSTFVNKRQTRKSSTSRAALGNA